MIEIRSLRSEEWPLWRDLRLQALAEAPYAFGSRLVDWQDADEARWRARLDVAGAANFVALLDDRAVGMASGIPADGLGPTVPHPIPYELISMWVHPDARGHGVGDRLIAAVADWASGGGARELTLSVVPANAVARALYRRNGFVETGEQDGEIVMVRRL